MGQRIGGCQAYCDDIGQFEAVTNRVVLGNHPVEGGSLHVLDHEIAVAILFEAVEPAGERRVARKPGEDVLFIDGPVACVTAVCIESYVMPVFLDRTQASRPNADIHGTKDSTPSALSQSVDDQIAVMQKPAARRRRDPHTGGLERIDDSVGWTSVEREANVRHQAAIRI
ncbi:hypothetical protein ASG82_24580 [Mycobacterium sp. Soil538]|nr:hypothetical protein ASG82_24580 [Mycobacterium sp. Soil538]